MTDIPTPASMTDDQIKVAYAVVIAREAAEASAKKDAEFAPIRALIAEDAFTAVLDKATELRAAADPGSHAFTLFHSIILGMNGLKTLAA